MCVGEAAKPRWLPDTGKALLTEDEVSGSIPTGLRFISFILIKSRQWAVLQKEEKPQLSDCFPPKEPETTRARKCGFPNYDCSYALSSEEKVSEKETGI